MKARFISFFLHSFLLSFLLLFLSRGNSLFASSRPIATNLSAYAKSTSEIQLSWDFIEEKTIAFLLVFRSTSPLSTSQDLLSLKPIATLSPEERTCIDTISESDKNLSFYYAIIAQFKDGSTYNVVLPSINATVQSVRVASEKIIYGRLSSRTAPPLFAKIIA